MTVVIMRPLRPFRGHGRSSAATARPCSDCPRAGGPPAAPACAAASKAARSGALPISASSHARMRQGRVPTPPRGDAGRPDHPALDVERRRRRDQRELVGRAVAHLEIARAAGVGAAGHAHLDDQLAGHAACARDAACRPAADRAPRPGSCARPAGRERASWRRARPARRRGRKDAWRRSGRSCRGSRGRR